MRRLTVFVVLMLAACQSLPGTAPRTIGQCLEQRGDAMLFNTGEPHEFMFNSLSACETEISRKPNESSPQQRN